ncbi:ribonuclease HI family protein [Aliicoccus persicus]|uniref:RNase HI n=1 Tax=Aliicoccus persicus TaxID=930138 RepID=A0A662Z0S8_9STAP|nr:ribonuclease HI family protein [Aliicoccus persicus]SEV83260.1 RNase HI [Aliicoccus persicus]HJE19679.1 ribonuclease HI family protein [Aliicoccus persicus]
MAKVYIDAAARTEPTLAASAGVIIDGDEKFTLSHCLGAVDNHEAEWHALIYALNFCQSKGITQVIVYTDSKIIVDSIEKRFVKNKVFKPFLQQVLQLEHDFTLMIVSHLARKNNAEADHLAKQQLFECLKALNT